MRHLIAAESMVSAADGIAGLGQSSPGPGPSPRAMEGRCRAPGLRGSSQGAARRRTCPPTMDVFFQSDNIVSVILWEGSREATACAGARRRRGPSVAICSTRVSRRHYVAGHGTGAGRPFEQNARRGSENPIVVSERLEHRVTDPPLRMSQPNDL